MKPRARGGIRLALSWLALGLLLACGGGAADGTHVGTAAREAVAPSIGFRSLHLLQEHYAKHGAEFGDVSQGEYLRRAQALRDAPVGGDVVELRRGDGSVSRFDRASGAFLAFDADGTIRTFFRPNDGERYFRRQARRRAARE